MDIYNELAKDHDEIKVMLEKALKDPNDNENLRSLAKELKIHSMAEEIVFYTKLIEKYPHLAKVIEGEVIEHKMAINLLKEIKDSKYSEEKKKVVITFLKLNIEAHIKKEEQEMFKIAKGSFSEIEEKEMLEKFQEEKDIFKSKKSGYEEQLVYEL